ncbi:MAG TPA: hypothetical protein VKA46_25635, partial [Gemmataceae bacterium]|nr:hypothetical protein [Gemmataceae bacterium]
MTIALRTSLFRICGAALLVTFALLSAGCGGTGTVTGKVFYKDKPLGGGTVVFWNIDGKGSKTSRIQPDGSYTMENMPAGPVKITVETKSARPSGAGQAPGQGRAPKMPAPPTDKLPPEADMGNVYGAPRPPGEKYVEIPADYGDMDKSDLTY